MGKTLYGEKPDAVINTGVYTTTCVLCKMSGLRDIIFINLHVEVKGKLVPIEKES